MNAKSTNSKTSKKSSTSTKPKENTKSLKRAKQRRRSILTFVRMCRYGVSNFSRNAWLTVAATAIMTITLLIVLFYLYVLEQSRYKYKQVYYQRHAK